MTEWQVVSDKDKKCPLCRSKKYKFIEKDKDGVLIHCLNCGHSHFVYFKKA